MQQHSFGHTSGSSYDAAGNTISFTDNNGDTTSLTYDSLNRLTGISYHDQTTVRYTYDAVGNRLTMTDGSGTMSYAYDGFNRLRLKSVAGSGFHLVQYIYDPVGNRIRMVYYRPAGRTVSYAYDNVNRLSSVTDWTAGKMTSYSYDANSNLVNMMYPNGRETGYTYDDGNRLVNLVNTDGAGVVSGYAYTLDAVGNRLQVTETGPGNSSSVTAYEYDLLSRLHTVTFPGTTVTYTYDPMGNRLSMATTAGNTSSTIAYSYDAGDQLLSAGETTYTYDSNGNRIEKNGPDGTTSYGYDAAGRLAGVSLPGSTLVEFAYDGDGNRLSKAVTSGNTTDLTQYVWDVNNMVERCFQALGKVTPPGKYLVVQACEALPDANPGIRSICCFGIAEQIRNMAALVHFDRDDPFSPVIVPWGPSCSTLITYPAGMAENAPKDSAFMGPQDPTQNRSLPPDMMAIGIPAGLAIRMAENLDSSFVVRRPRVAFPVTRPERNRRTTSWAASIVLDMRSGKLCTNFRTALTSAPGPLQQTGVPDPLHLLPPEG